MNKRITQNQKDIGTTMTCRHCIKRIIWLLFFSFLLLILVACGHTNNHYVDSETESSENTMDITSEIA